eukprot:743580-Prorocentrum_lima.AAC.1
MQWDATTGEGTYFSDSRQVHEREVQDFGAVYAQGDRLGADALVSPSGPIRFALDLVPNLIEVVDLASAAL